MKAIFARLVSLARRVDERLIKYGFLVFMLVLAIIHGSPIDDGTGGVR
jgi:hypothetical protein